MKIICYSTRLDANFEAVLEFENDLGFSISIVFDENKFTCIGGDFIDALRKLRLDFLEPNEIIPLLNGCRRDFVASRMQRQSTGGKVGFLFAMGRMSQKEDLVQTFGFAPVEAVACVADQDMHYRKWLGSLKNERN